MTPENTVFVPLDQLGRKPDHDDHPLPREHEFAGEALLARADEIIEHDHRLAPEQRAVARERLREVIAAHTMNAPVMLLSLAEDTDTEIARAAYATPEVWLHKREHGDWTLAMRQYAYDYNMDWNATDMHYSIWTFLGDVRNGATRLLVGEEEVTTWLQGRSLGSVHMDEPSTFHFERDMNILRQMMRANMPLDYLGLTDEQRQQMGNIIIAYAIEDSYHARNAFDLVEYLFKLETPEERNHLYIRLAEGLADILPVTYTDPASPRLFGVMESFAKQSPTIPGQPQGIELGENARRTFLLAHLYRRRSEMTRTVPDPLPEPQRPRAEGVERLPLQEHRLNMFTKNDPSLSELWQDVDYIHVAGREIQNPDHASHLTELRAKTLSGQFHRLIMNEDVALGDLPPIFGALEIMFEADDETSRQHLYADVLYALTRDLPIHNYGKGNLNRVVGVLEVLLPHMPDSLRNYRGDELSGPAEVAAVIADMYDYRANFYIQADITRTGQDQD